MRQIFDVSSALNADRAMDAVVLLEDREPVGQNPAVGFNPFRQQRRRSSDYVMVAAAFLVVAVLLLWAALP